MFLFCICLVGSQSKAAILAVTLLGIVNFLFLLSGWRRVLLFIGMVSVGLVGVVSRFNFANAINAYVEGAARYQNLSMLRSDDGNIVMGRVAGAVLSPRMIAAHPLLGIGWGNYAWSR